MTTKEFLSENRNEVISFYNSNIKRRSNITLKDFMLMLLTEYKETVKGIDIYSSKNLMYNLFDIQYKVVENSDIETKYTKPYSESNHSKMVNYYGKEKTKQFYML